MKNIVIFISEESGFSSMEYALIASLIAIVIIAGVTALGTSLQGLYNNVASKL